MMNTVETIPKKKRRFTAADAQLTLISLPGMLYLLLFSYIPMFGVIIAFKNYRYDLGILGSPWVGLENFKFFFQSSDAVRIIGNTVFMHLLLQFTGTIANIAFALIMFEVQKKFFVKTYQTIMILPNFISWVVVGYMFYAFLNPSLGIINKTLEMFGIEGVQWYSEPGVWPWILVYANIWKGVGMGSIMYYGSLMAIDHELFEAAELDGANKLQRTWYISLAEIVPMIIMLTIISLAGILSCDFGMFYNLTRNSSLLYKTTDVLDTYIFRALREYGDVNTSAAVGFAKSITGFVLILIVNGIVRKVDDSAAMF